MARDRRTGGVRPFERGGIKFAVMTLLKERPRHGYDIIRAMEENSGGMYSPSAGAIYPVLQALEDRDLVTSTTEEEKRVYSLTTFGLAFLEEHKDEAKRHRERWAAHLALDDEVREAIDHARDTFERVMDSVQAAAGDAAKREEMLKLLEEVADRIEHVAGDSRQS